MTSVQMMDQMFPRTTVTEEDKRRSLENLLSVKEEVTAHRKFSDYLKSMFPNAVAVYLFLIFATTMVMVYFLISLFGKMQGLYDKAQIREKASNEAIITINQNAANIKQMRDSLFIWHYQGQIRSMVIKSSIDSLRIKK